MTLKAMNYCAMLRSRLRLVERSPIVHTSTLANVRAECTHFLEYNTLHYPPSLERIGIPEQLSYAECKEALQVHSDFDMNERQIAYQKWMAAKQADAQTAKWRWRIGQHAEEKQAAGWYPFFVTLTLDPMKITRWKDGQDFWQNSGEWQKYLRRVSKHVTKTLGHRPYWKTNTPLSEYLTYAAVIEHGKKRTHHHVHAILWLRAIPEGWKRDPNEGIKLPSQRFRRECKGLTACWNWSTGQSPALYFRSQGDVWQQLGHATPVRQGMTTAIKLAPPMLSGLYLAKYMGKEHKEWNHRIKCTRGIGMESLKKLLETMSIEELRTLSLRPSNLNSLLSLSTIHTVPIGLLRSAAKTILFCKEWASGLRDTETLLRHNSGPFLRMLLDVRRGTNPLTMPSTLFYDWVSQFLPDPIEYCDHALLEAHEKIGEVFPRYNFIETDAIPGNTTA